MQLLDAYTGLVCDARAGYVCNSTVSATQTGVKGAVCKENRLGFEPGELYVQRCGEVRGVVREASEAGLLYPATCMSQEGTCTDDWVYVQVTSQE